LNGGFCKEASPNTGVFVCECPDGWAGDRCQNGEYSQTCSPTNWK